MENVSSRIVMISSFPSSNSRILERDNIHSLSYKLIAFDVCDKVERMVRDVLLPIFRIDSLVDSYVMTPAATAGANSVRRPRHCIQEATNSLEETKVYSACSATRASQTLR